MASPVASRAPTLTDSNAASTSMPAPDLNEKTSVDGAGTGMGKVEAMPTLQSGDADAKAVAGADAMVDPEDRYVTGRKLAIIFTGLLLAIFLVALDQTIVATALPKIVSQFNSLSQVTWVATAYFLTQAGFILFFGQLLTVAPTKGVFMGLICLFELGSLLCGVAPNMNVLIFGRAVAGVGAGGIFVCILVIISQITRLEQRPLLFGLFGAVFALSSVLGPLLGGAFTDKVSWRWCFYINLPVGAVSVAFIGWFLKAQPAPANPHFPTPGWRKYLGLDWLGITLALAMTTALLLPLQWGGTTKAWTDPSVYALFPVFGVLLAAFLLWERRMGPRAIMPLHLFRRRSQIGCCLEAFFLNLGMLIATYYLPLWYQSTKGATATKSGLDILPLMISLVVAAAGSGVLLSVLGRYWYFVLLSPLIFAVGGGLLYTVGVDTANARIIGFQIIYGFGIGGALQNVILAIQAEYADDEQMIPQATSLVNFTQLLGGVIGIAIAGTVFNNQLHSNLPSTLPADVAAQVVASVTVIKTLAEPVRGIVIAAYVQSLRPVFVIAVPAGALASLSAFLIKNHNLKERGGLHGAGMA